MVKDDSRYPEDKEYTIYIIDNMLMTIQDIIDRAKEKWGENISLDRIDITGEEIQVRCFGYDQYDPSDYCRYLVVSYFGEL